MASNHRKKKRDRECEWPTMTDRANQTVTSAILVQKALEFPQ